MKSVDEKDDLEGLLTVAEKAAIDRLIGLHGTVQYLVTELERLHAAYDKMQARIDLIEKAVGSVVLTHNRKKLLTDESVSLLLPSSAIREVRKVAKQYVLLTSNEGKGARLNKETDELIVDLSDSRIKPELASLNCTLSQLHQKLMDSGRAVKPKKFHRLFMEWEFIPPYAVVIPAE